jgi:hypothetical protein
VTTSDDSGVCVLDGGTQHDSNGYTWVVGPYANDGPVVLTFACTDQFSNTATQSITLNVLPPYVPPSDVFTVSGADPYTFTWSTSSRQGAGGCTVQVLNNSGVNFSPAMGGTPSGSATTAFLSPSGDPWTATLICSGSPDAGVPALTLSP